MNKPTQLPAIRADDELLDLIGDGARLTDLPEEYRDELVKLCIDWRKGERAKRGTQW